jgi:hypothetical protein
MKIREFYLDTFSTDKLGREIDPTATFGGLFETLDTYRDVYEYIGVADSIIRERVFEKLASVLGYDYADIHAQWLYAI